MHFNNITITHKQGNIMADNNTTYVVVNIETKEIYQSNGAIAEFANYHEAKQIQIANNDCDNIVHDIEGTTSTWTERPKLWQIVEFQSISSRAETRIIDIQISRGVYEKGQKITYRAIGDIKTIKRAPDAKSGRRTETINVEQVTIELESIKSNIRRLEARIQTIESRKASMEPGLQMMQAMEQIIKAQIQINKDRDEARRLGIKLMNGVQQRRKAQNIQNQTAKASNTQPVVVRRKSS